VTAPVPAPTRARATSLLGALQSPLQTQPSSQLPGVKAPEPKTQDEKKGRRGFSIDFRSLGFGSTETKPEAKPQLKPLQLASRAAPANSNLVSNANVTSNTTYSPPMAANSILPAVAGGRKLELQEEDEEDRRERHRLEAALKLMGIDRTPPVENAPLPTPVATVPTPTSTTGSTSWFRFSRSRASTVSSAPASATTPSTAKPPSPPMTAAERVSSTPLSRMSSAFGDSSGSPLAPFVDLADSPDDPDKVAAALREYDAREQEQARLIAAGKGPAAYTSPPRPRRGSALSAMSPPRSPRALPHARGDSISTLWSMGSATESADDKDEEK
jgi:hypothetical protein